MTPSIRMLLVASLATVALAAAAACLDLTPVDYGGPEDSSTVDVLTGDGGAADGDAGDGDSPGPPTCLQCINTPDDAMPPGCETEIAECLANAACAATYACALANNCFQQGSFKQIVNCGLPCAEDAGISSPADPAIILIYSIATCAQASCNGPCAIGDASIPSTD